MGPRRGSALEEPFRFGAWSSLLKESGTRGTTGTGTLFGFQVAD